MIATLCLIAQAAAPAALTQYGPIEGINLGGVHAFKGIPFAAPPVGRLRWQLPQPHPGWTAPLKCQEFGPACPQKISGNSLRQQAPPRQSEDCLTLNVWTKPGLKGAPVMVWIHGGGHQQGASSMPIYDGAKLAKKGVVLVSINYRLGIFGFLAHAQLTREQGASGNYGYYDQLAALKWVRANAAQFGGNPDNVTIFGQSAGAVSCANLMTSPLAKGLFHKVILHSGGATGRLRTLSEAETRGAELLAPTGAKTLAAMRALSTEDLLNVSPSEIGSPGKGARDWPVIDGRLLTEGPLDAWVAGRAAKVPLMAGATKDDGSMFARAGRAMTPRMVEQQIRSTFGQLADEALRIYPCGTQDEARQSFADLNNDSFILTVRRMALISALQGSPSYHWHFSRALPAFERAGLGAFHGAELPYVFGTQSERMYGAEDTALADTIRDAWVRFAASGNPNGGSLPEWPPFSKAAESTMVLDLKPAVVGGVRTDAARLWDKGFGLGG